MSKFNSWPKRLIVIVFLFLYCFQLNDTPVFAQLNLSPTPVDYQLPFPGILPDHPLYLLKRVRDWLLITLNNNPVTKTETKLLFADKKIAMAQSLFDKKEYSLAADILLESQNDLLEAGKYLPKMLKENSLPAGLADKIELSAKKHKEIISKINITSSKSTWKEQLEKASLLNNQATTIITSVK